MDLAYLLLDIDQDAMTPAERLAHHLQHLNEEATQDPLGPPDLYSSEETVSPSGAQLDDALAAMTQAYLAAFLSSVADPPPPRPYRSPTNGGRPTLPLLPRFDTRSESGPECSTPLNMRAMTSKSTGGVGSNGSYMPSFFNNGGQSPGGAWGNASTGRASKSGGGMSFQKMQCFKTKQCRFWLDGRCTRGDECTFAHCDGELRDKPDLTKTKICAKWRAGQCPKSAEECTYAHGVEYLRTLHANGSSSNASRSELDRSPIHNTRTEDPLLSKLAAFTTTLNDPAEEL